MEKHKGILRKMQTELKDPVEYAISLSNTRIKLTEALGKPLSLAFTGKIYCIQCERKISKSFQQGYCYPCYRRLLACNLCLIHPERCLVESGNCPTDDWAHAQCHQAHVIYLANSSGLKVGITRHTQVPTRWIDQGAIQAIPLLEVGNRYRAGTIEVALKAFVNDKTNWRKMLKNEVESLNMVLSRSQLLASAKDTIEKAAESFGGEFKVLESNPVTIHYPVIEYPKKIISLSLEKTPEISAKLMGIKGQYLILETGVINLRKFGGYEVEVAI